MMIGINDLPLISRSVVNLENKKQKKPMVIIEDKCEEEAPNNLKGYITI